MYNNKIQIIKRYLHILYKYKYKICKYNNKIQIIKRYLHILYLYIQEFVFWMDSNVWNGATGIAPAIQAASWFASPVGSSLIPTRTLALPLPYKRPVGLLPQHGKFTHPCPDTGLAPAIQAAIRFACPAREVHSSLPGHWPPTPAIQAAIRFACPAREVHSSPPGHWPRPRHTSGHSVRLPGTGSSLIPARTLALPPPYPTRGLLPLVFINYCKV